ncbi:MAG: DNA repair protein RecN, partial [Clostridia bacterium]|nr:DNA repair protein RecN [Clostridia bacterium]
LSLTGKNVCRINGVLTTLATLKEVSDLLVDIHGQHEHQSLLHEKNHIAMLDEFGEGIEAAKEATADVFIKYTGVKKRLLALAGSDGDRERRIDMLHYQIDEIQKTAIEKGEKGSLALQKKRMNAQERIMEALSSAYGALYEDDNNVLLSLKDVKSSLISLDDVDKKYTEFAGKADEAYYILEEIAASVRDEMDESYYDANELEEIEERLALISSLSKKYGDALLDGEYIKNAQQELTDLVDSEELIGKLEEELTERKTALYARSVKLSELRSAAAFEFAQKIQEQLSDLGMLDASFSVHVSDIKSIDECAFSRNGIDSVAFYISTNRGEPQKALRKIASGGEVSRIMLALKNIAANEGGIPTMIFDEIDVGISGRMAQVVARKLQNIANARQVVCVTHLPQIASMADTHFLILKSSSETKTTTSLTKLEGDIRIDEIARLAGGDSSVSAQHAKEMLQRAGEYKKVT